MNLHSVWDTALLRTYIGSTHVADYADRLVATLTPGQADGWSSGTPVEWANESHLAAREHVYKGVPADGPPPKLSEDYVSENRPVVERQLIKGGLRLARVLNEAFSTAAPAASPIAEGERVSRELYRKLSPAIYVAITIAAATVIISASRKRRRGR